MNTLKPALGDTFKLEGTTGPTFKAVALYKAAGFIPAVNGISLDGKQQTFARVVDVDWE